MQKEMPMKKGGVRSFWLPLLAIPVGGVVIVALTLALYLGLYLLLESLFYSNNPQAFPADTLRRWSTVALVGLYLLLLRTRLPELLKAILLTGPLAAVIITTGHALSMWPVVSIAAMFGVVIICGVLLYRYKKPWIYYYAGAIGALIGLIYAWPRPHLNEPGFALLIQLFSRL